MSSDLRARAAEMVQWLKCFPVLLFPKSSKLNIITALLCCKIYNSYQCKNKNKTKQKYMLLIFSGWQLIWSPEAGQSRV